METLALIEALDRDGHPRQVLRVGQWPVRIGRAIDCDLVLDDPHVAALHATLAWREDGMHVMPEASVNGVRLGAALIAPGSSPRLPPSGLLTMGATTLRVRLAGDAVGPELRFVDLHRHERRHAVQLAALIVLAAVWEGFIQWLTTVPGTPGSALAMSYLAKPAFLMMWCTAWAIGSMLFQHRFAFWPHLRVALTWLLLGALTAAATAQIAFALSMPLFEKLGQVVFIGTIAMMLWRHLGLLLPQRRRAAAIAIGSAIAAAGCLTLVGRSVAQEPLIGELYLGTISLPAVRLVKPVSTAAFVTSAAPLETTLSRWAKPGDDDENETGADED
jgi:hypothetical protein